HGRAAEQQQTHLTQGLKAALETTLDAHQRRLSTLEKQALDQGAGLMERIAALATAIRDTGREQRDALTKVAASLSGPLEALAKVQEGEKQLLRLQETLNQKDRKSTRLNSSHQIISYAVFCVKKEIREW